MCVRVCVQLSVYVLFLSVSLSLCSCVCVYIHTYTCVAVSSISSSHCIRATSLSYFSLSPSILLSHQVIVMCVCLCALAGVHDSAPQGGHDVFLQLYGLELNKHASL